MSREPVDIVDAPEILFHPRCDGRRIEIVISAGSAVFVKPITLEHAASMMAQLAQYVAQMVAKA